MSSAAGVRCKLLVVGRSGQLAIALAGAATRRSIACETAGRPSLDIADAAAVARALATARPDAVINAAAYTDVDKAESEPERCSAVNRDGPGHLAAACRRAGLPLIHLSTDMVFPDTPGAAHREDDPTGPLGAYGLAKLEGERRVADAHVDALIVRVSWVFGPAGDNFVTKLLAWARARPELSIVADQRGRPTYAPDLAEALLGLALAMLEPGGTATSRPSGLLHIAGGDILARDEQARIVMAASAARGGPTARILPVPTAHFPTPARRALNAALDISRAAGRHGIRLGRFADDVERTLDVVLGPRRA